MLEFIPLGYLPRAAYHREVGEYALGERDLEAVQTIVRRTGMKLYEADVLLERVRLSLAKGHGVEAKAHLEKAEELVQEMKYHRRLPEVEALKERV